MDTSRLIRYTIPGWVLIFSVLVQYWVFGGTLSALDLGGLTTTAMGAVIGFLIAFASSAGLGLVVSTISGGVLYFCLGLQSEFRLPRNSGERQLYIDGLKRSITTPAFQNEIDSLTALPNDPQKQLVWRKQNVKSLVAMAFTYFQMSYRMAIPAAVADYSTRRWNAFWTHLNSIYAIVLGTLLIWTRILFGQGMSSIGFDGDRMKLCSEGLILLYVAIGLFQLHRARREAMDIDYRCTIEPSKENKESEKKNSET